MNSLATWDLLLMPSPVMNPDEPGGNAGNGSHTGSVLTDPNAHLSITLIAREEAAARGDPGAIKEERLHQEDQPQEDQQGATPADDEPTAPDEAWETRVQGLREPRLLQGIKHSRPRRRIMNKFATTSPRMAHADSVISANSSTSEVQRYPWVTPVATHVPVRRPHGA